MASVDSERTFDVGGVRREADTAEGGSSSKSGEAVVDVGVLGWLGGGVGAGDEDAEESEDDSSDDSLLIRSLSVVCTSFGLAVASEKYLEDDGPGAMRMFDSDCVGVSGEVE